jgi:hypothetical protein
MEQVDLTALGCTQLAMACGEQIVQTGWSGVMIAAKTQDL